MRLRVQGLWGSGFIGFRVFGLRLSGVAGVSGSGFIGFTV